MVVPLDDTIGAAGLRLAEWLADPAGWLPSGAGGQSVLPDDLRDMMAASPVLRPALNRWLARNAGLDQLALDHAVLARLSTDPDSDAAIALLTASPASQLQSARMLGAALWADRIRLALLKSDRERLAALLGADAVAFGLRRATVFARPLTELGAKYPATDPVIAGRTLCAAVLARVAPLLADLLRLSHPALPTVDPLTEAQARAAWSVLALPEARA